MNGRVRLVCLTPGHAVRLAMEAGAGAYADGVEADLTGLEAGEVDRLARWALRSQLAVDDAVEHMNLSRAA